MLATKKRKVPPALFANHQEFLPLLRVAAKASDIKGMSCKKAAVVSISSALGSLQLAKEATAMFGATALAYRTSKASDDLPHLLPQRLRPIVSPN